MLANLMSQQPTSKKLKGLGSKQEQKLADLEAKYAKIQQRSQQLANPYYLQELREQIK